MEQEQYKNYMEMFKEYFGIDAINNIDFSKMNLLKIIFNYFAEDLYKPSKKYFKLQKDYVKVSDALIATLSEEQQELYNQQYELENRMTAELEEQLFIFGCIVRKQTKIRIRK